MGILSGVVVALALLTSSAEAASPRSCPAGVPVATFNLTVRADRQSEPIALRAMNVVRDGEWIRYEPVGVRFTRNKKARVALIVVPQDSEGSPRILPARPARSAAEWQVPFRATAIGLVLGPDGIDEKKLSAMFDHDPGVVDRLADYAEQHTKVEALIQALASYEQSAPGSGTLQAALKGFSSQYGVDLPTIDRTKPTDEQAATLLRAITPALAKPSPTGTLAEQSGGLAASVAGLFFGPPVGLAVGGAALAGSLHTTLFPPADFQSAFTQPDAANHLILCTDADKHPAKARIEFVWMTRVPDADAPAVTIGGSPRIPGGWRSTLNVRCTTIAQLKALPRAREWRLVSASKSIAVPVQVEPSADSDTLTIDLTKLKVPPGDYGLEAMWDWSAVRAAGHLVIHEFADLGTVTISANSRDRLVAGRGVVTIDLAGADFEFVNRVSLAPADRSAAATPLTFTISTDTAGDAGYAHVTIDTHSLPAGAYELTLAQLNGVTQKVPITVHSPMPTLAGTPLRTNLGETSQTVHLRGSGLERIDRITSTDATWTLAPTAPDARDITERDAQVQLGPNAHRGEHLSLSLFVKDLHAPVDVANGALVVDPRPKIRAVEVSFAGQPEVELRAGEIPTGVPSGFAIRGDGFGVHPTAVLTCEDDTAPGLTLAADQRSGSSTLDRTGRDTLFLSTDPGRFAAPGCLLDLVVVDAATGSSDVYRLGRTVRLPRIETFSLTDEQTNAGLYAGMLRGKSLELVERVGWTADASWPVQGIATPVPDDPALQTLRIVLPWPSPSPHARLFIWLRDEHEPRRTNARY